MSDPTPKDVLPLFSGVKLEGFYLTESAEFERSVDVTIISLDPYRNERVLTGDAAKAALTLVKAMQGKFVGSDRIQPFTWNFETFSRPEHAATPMVLQLTVFECWTALEKRRGVGRIIRYERNTGLAIYEVNLPFYEARQWQGHHQFRGNYHANSIQLERDAVEALIEGLGL